MAAIGDPGLNNNGIIIIDKAHQHTISTNSLLGLLKRLAQKRKDLKIIILSATIEADLLKFFSGSAIEKISGRAHKLVVSYLTQPQRMSSPP